MNLSRRVLKLRKCDALYFTAGLSTEKHQLGEVSQSSLKDRGVSKMNGAGNKIKSWFENQLECKTQKQRGLLPFRLCSGVGASPAVQSMGR